MSKSLLAGLKQIAQTHPETRHHLVPLIRQAAITRQDLAFFDKPGLYKPVQVQRLTLGGSYTYSGYLRDEEIQEGEQKLRKYIQGSRTWVTQTQKEFAVQKGKAYEGYLQSYKTPEKAVEAFDAWVEKLERVEHAGSLKELAANIAPIEEPAEYKGKLMLLRGGRVLGSGHGSDPALHRHTVVEQAEEEGPKSVLQLIAAGIQLEDRPGWGAAADATRKAEDFLKRRRVQLLADLRLQAESYAEKTFAELAVRYPMADTKQLPGQTWLWGIFRDI